MQLHKRAITAGGRVYSAEMSGRAKHAVLIHLKGSALEKIQEAGGASCSMTLQPPVPKDDEVFWAGTNIILARTAFCLDCV
jgi:hypothetical protein